jgi:hypothetical protein
MMVGLVLLQIESRASRIRGSSQTASVALANLSEKVKGAATISKSGKTAKLS